MTERYISGQPEGWSETNEGHATIYEMAPSAIPADQAARVIYELRLDVERLNNEVIETHARFEAQPIERTWMFTISANFTAPSKQEAWDEWSEWLTNPGNVEDGTQVTENLPDDRSLAQRYLDGEPSEYDDGTPSIHLDGLFEALVNDDGTEGQDRESYTDTQDRKSYDYISTATATKLNTWRQAVASGDTLLSYNDWCWRTMSAEDRAAWERDSYG